MARLSKRERRAIGRLKGEVEANEFMSRRRATFAEDDRRIIAALERCRESERRTLEWIKEVEG